MAYKRVNWENLPSTNTPVNATNLNKMDEGINAKQDKLIAGTGIEITGKNIINNIQGNYSTDEIRIGNWVNGKPLYRKVIQTTSPSVEDTNTNIYTITENIETVIRLDGYIQAWNPKYRGNINCFVTSSDYIATWFLINSSGYPAYIRCRHHNRGDSPMRIIMEYTKTTD